MRDNCVHSWLTTELSTGVLGENFIVGTLANHGPLQIQKTRFQANSGGRPIQPDLRRILGISPNPWFSIEVGKQGFDQLEPLLGK